MDMLEKLRDEYRFVGLPDDNADGGRRRTSRERSDSVFGTIHRAVGSGVLEVISYDDISSPITPPSFYEIEKSAGTKLIGMDSQGDITAAPGEEKKIATWGLSGCTAVAVVSEFADGTKRGYIQHYSPLGDQLSGLVLHREMRGVEQQSPVSCKMVIMTPGEYYKDPDGKWIMTPRSQECVDNLITESGISNDKDVKVYPYDLVRGLGSYGQGTLMIKFDHDGETTVYTEMLPVKFDEELEVRA